MPAPPEAGVVGPTAPGCPRRFAAKVTWRREGPSTEAPPPRPLEPPDAPNVWPPAPPAAPQELPPAPPPVLPASPPLPLLFATMVVFVIEPPTARRPPPEAPAPPNALPAAPPVPPGRPAA